MIPDVTTYSHSTPECRPGCEHVWEESVTTSGVQSSVGLRKVGRLDSLTIWCHLKKSGRTWRYGILENVHWSSWSWRMALANNMAQCFGTHLWEWLVDRLFSSRSCCPDGPWTVFMYRSFGLVLCCIFFVVLVLVAHQSQSDQLISTCTPTL